MYSDYSSQERHKFIYENFFFPRYTTSNYLRSFFIIMNVNFEIFIITHYMCFYISMMNQKQPPEASCKKAILKNFVIFTGKHLCWSLFLIKFQTFRPDSKRDSNTGILLWILQKFLEHLFWKTSANCCFWSNVHYYILSNEKS